jgi:rhomboid protease GluP
MGIIAGPYMQDSRYLKQFAIFFLAVFAIYTILLAIPSATEALLLDRTSLFSGEFWRLFTYQFVHDSMSHLAGNIVALLLSVVLAIEVKAIFNEYSATYFSSGVLAILPLWLFLPFTALGASTAIYGSFGFLSRSASRFRIKPYVLLILVTALATASAVYSYYSYPSSLAMVLKQLAAHLSGLYFGYLFSMLVIRLKAAYPSRRWRCLRSTT